MAKESVVMAQVQKFLNEHDFVAIQNGDALRGQEVGDNAQWQWTIRYCGHGGGLVTCCAYCPLKVPARRRAAVAEYITRATWSINFGNFEMNWSDGNVVFRTGIPVTASGVSEKAIEHLVYAPLYIMDRYLPGLLAVALGNADPKKTVEDAEKDDSVAEDKPSSAEATAESESSIEAPTKTEPEDGPPARPARRGRLFGSEN